MLERLKRELGRLHVRLLLVNAVVLLVPVAGLEFARLFERELLYSLEREMRNQAILVRHLIDGENAFDDRYEAALARAAESTRTRIRVLDREGTVRLDSHRFGPPEGEEPPPPRSFGKARNVTTKGNVERSTNERWDDIPGRIEVKAALAGQRGAFTRVRTREPSVILFVTEPLTREHSITGAVYVTRSTRPVMVELYRIRSGLQRVLAIALVFTVGVSFWLAYSITQPLGRLSKVATRIARGETNLEIPISGSGELRELASALEVMTTRLRRRMQDTAAFAADVAHGFKSPLTSIRGAAELLRQGAADDPEARERFLNNIELDSERLDRLVTRLLELSRIEASAEAKTIIDLHELLRRIAERSSTPDVAVVVAGARDVWVRGRKADLETAFANLMDNAVKFSCDARAVQVDVDVDAESVFVRVRDHGQGVPEEAEARLFQRFFTTDTDHGTGLGLAIVKSAVEAHGGTVTHERASTDPGACFLVTLKRLVQHFH